MKKSLFYRPFHDEYKDYKLRDFFKELTLDDAARYCTSALLIYTGMLFSYTGNPDQFVHSGIGIFLGETGVIFGYLSSRHILRRLKD